MDLNPIDFFIDSLFEANELSKINCITVNIKDIDLIKKQANVMLKTAIQHAYISGALAHKNKNLDVNFFIKYYENERN